MKLKNKFILKIDQKEFTMSKNVTVNQTAKSSGNSGIGEWIKIH